MHNLFALIRKELRLYCVSPIVYVVGMVFLGISDYLFYAQAAYYSSLSAQMMRFQGNLPQMNIHQAVFRPPFLNMGVILLFIIPILTMRLFSEEKKSRTLELLLTSPLRLTEIILGKFIAAGLIYLALLVASLHFPILMSFFTEVDWKPLAVSYLGLILMGGLFISMGLFASSLTENQIVSAVLGFGILIGLWLTGAASQEGGASLAGYFSLIDHLDNFMKGLIDTADLAYFISMILFGLFLTHRVVESHRWR
jgi:ABC-2 type transport system permease protein